MEGEDNVAGMSAANEAAGPFEGFVLGIESSCDDTACAVLDAEGRVLSSVVSSQLDVHRPFGGVVPEAASREHLRNWPAARSKPPSRSITACNAGSAHQE